MWATTPPRFKFLIYIKLRSRWLSDIFPFSSFNNPSLSAIPVPHVHPYLPIPPLCPRVQCQVVSYTTSIPDTGRRQGDFTNLRMGHYHLYPVPPRRRAVRPLLVLRPFCRWRCCRIHNRTVVCLTPRFSHRSPYTDTPDLVEGLVGWHTPMCFTYTE